jgi:putative membrane protein
MKGGTFMITKRMCGRILLGSASTLLVSAMAVAQYQPGGGGQQQPNMPNQQQPRTPTTGTMGPNDSLANQQAMADQAFVRKALEGGAAEVQLGQLAQQKSQSEDVKQFGQKMVEDHTQLGEQLKPIAQQLGVKEPKGPSKKDKQLMAKLEGLSGQQFDEAYIQAMVKDHKDDLKEFKDEAQSTQNQNVKQVAQEGAGVISQHLQLIQQIAQNHNITTEGKSKTTPSTQ